MSNSGASSQAMSKEYCQPCSCDGKKSQAAIFCPTCNEYQCKECSNGHNLYNIMKNHALLDVNIAVERLADLNGVDQCKIHNKRFEYFCEDDDKLCCSACVIFDHRQCNNVQDIEGLATDVIRQNQLKESLLGEKEKCTAVSKHWTDCERKLQDQLQNISDYFVSMRTSIRSISNNLERQEINIKHELESFEKKSTKFSQSRLDCECIITQLENDLGILEDTERLGSRAQIFISRQKFEESFAKLNIEAEHIFAELENTDVVLEVNENLETLIESGNHDMLESETRHVVLEKPVILEKILSIDLPLDDSDIEEPLYTGMDFLPDGRLVAVDNYNNKCLIFDENLCLLKSFEVSQYPHSVIAISDNEIVITLDGELKIEFLGISSSNEITQIKTVKTNSQYHSICLKDAKHFVVGLIEGEKPVRIVSRCGKETDFKVEFPVQENPDISHTCTYIKSARKIVMSAWHEDVVFIIDIDTDTTTIVKDDQIKVPKGLAIGPFDIIFVCSSYTNSIVQISPNGHILASNKLDIDFPYRICVAKDKTKVVVANNVAGHRMLQLLKIGI